MSHAHKVACYTRLLRANPAWTHAPLPELETLTPEDVVVWKQRIRAFDEAVIRLGIKTAAQVQRKNSAFPPPTTPSRIIKWATYLTCSVRQRRRRKRAQARADRAEARVAHQNQAKAGQ